MSTLLPPLQGVELSVALAEAATFAPANRVILDTIEIDDGTANPIRLVADFTPLVTSVGTFLPCAMSDELPSQTEDGDVQMTINIFGVSHPAVEAIRQASQTTTPVAVRFRQYSVDMPSGTPEMTTRFPMNFELADVPVINATNVQLKCRFGSANNRGFPRKHYTLAEYPSLVA